MEYRVFISLLWCLSGSLLLTRAPAHAAPLQAVVSIQPLALLVEEVGGTAVSVTTLLPATSDPHNFALRVSDRQRLEQADLVIWLGPQFEHFLAKPLAAKVEQLELGALAGLEWPPTALQVEASGPGGRDLHMWLNLSNAALIARAVSARLQQLLPAQQVMLSQRLVATLAHLNALDESLQESFKPVRQRPFGVYHAGYDHFVSHFGLAQRLSFTAMPDQHLSAKQLQAARIKLADASCVITDVSENNREQLQHLLTLPVYVADPLAQTRMYRDFSDYIDSLRQVFLACLAGVQ